MTDISLTLYDYGAAPSPRRARMFLSEKGLRQDEDYTNIQIDLKIGEQLGEAYKAINPRCTVPALITPEAIVLSENAAIAAYLEAAYPQPALLGDDATSRAMIAQWNWRCEFEGLAAVAEILRNHSPHMKDRALTGPQNIAQIPELVTRGRIRLDWFFDMLDQQLQSHEFVAGAEYSIADITATVTVDFAKWVKAAPKDSHTALKAWHERMKLRDNYEA